jgi:putative membrane protein
MARSQFDQAACDKLAQCVRDLEAETDAEVVIVVRSRSGTYRDADFLFGAMLSFAGLLFLLYSPFDFHHFWVAIDVLLLFLLGFYASSHTDRVRRLMTTEKRRAAAVRTHAAAMFYEAGIANTETEMGVLVYLSLLEQRLELIADRGVLKAAPPQEWNKRLADLTEAGRKPQLRSLTEALRSLGSLLARHIPATGENPNELPDMPRFDLK